MAEELSPAGSAVGRRKAPARTQAKIPAGRPRTARPAASGTVTMQARIDVGFARELVEHDAAVLGHDVSFVNATDLHSIDKSRLRRQRGRLHPRELMSLEEAIRTYLGL